MCSNDLSYVTPEKVYTQKEIVLLETLISEFHKNKYTPEIQKLELNLPHVGILGNHHCDKELCEVFKRWNKQHENFIPE